MNLNVNDDFMGVMSQKGAGHVFILYIHIRIYFLPFHYIVYFVPSLLFIAKLNCPEAVTHKYPHLQDQ